MFYGQWKTVIDEKWRLRLPNYLRGQFRNLILFKIGKNGCIEMHRLGERLKEKEMPYVFFQKVKSERVIIPEALRGSISFYFGKKVILAGKGTYIEIWPWT